MLNILQHARGNITHIKKVNYTPMWFHIRVNNSSLSFCLWSVCMRDTHLPVQIDSAVSFLFLWSWIPQWHLSSKWYHFKKFLLSGLRTCDVTGHSDTSFLRKITRAIKQTGNELYVVDSLDFCLKGVLYISVLIWVKDVYLCSVHESICGWTQHLQYPGCHCSILGSLVQNSPSVQSPNDNRLFTSKLYQKLTRSGKSSNISYVPLQKLLFKSSRFLALSNQVLGLKCFVDWRSLH